VKGWKINRLIAIHTLVSAFAGISLAGVLFLGFIKLENKQLQIADEAIILKDVLRVEETFRQWLVMMDLVIGNDQTYLATGAKRQAILFLDLVGYIGQHSITNTVQNDIEEISTQTHSIISLLDLVIDGKSITPNVLTEFDNNSTIMLELLFNIKKSTGLYAKNNVLLLDELRTKTIVISIVSGLIFISFIATQWILLALYLVRPVQKLSKAVTLAQQQNHCFEYANDSGPVEIKGLAADFLFFINKLEEMAEQAQKANTAKSDFLSTMSHEIRTPLNAIIGFSEMLKETQLNQDQNEYSTIINQSGNSLLTLINDILDFSKIEAGKMQVDLLWFDIYDLLITVLATNRHVCKRKSLVLNHNIDLNVPRYLYGDEQKVRQILLNLLSNALKFTEQGFISLNLKVEKLTSTVCVINISVIDTGIGIAKEKQAKLFKSFTQEDTSTTRKYGGTGLGLAIVDKMATLLGGSIVLQSEQGKGSMFSLQLPLSLDPEEADETFISPTKIVLIEGSNNELSMQLRNLGYAVEVMSFEECEILCLEGSFTTTYQLLLFSQASVEQAIRWRNGDKFNRQQIPVAYCLNSSGEKNPYLTEIPDIKISNDGLSIVEQINHLLNSHKFVDTIDEFQMVGTVLVVEDNPVNLLMTQKILKQIGIDSISASNGQQAVELYQSDNLALILMDCQMPVMDGYEATQEIRSLEAKKFDNDYHLPIIALTANVFKEEKDACIKAGMDDFIGKPFKKKQIIDTIRKWLKAEVNIPNIVQDESINSTDNILDMTILNELMAMDEEGSTVFITHISQVFLNDTKQLFQKIEIALLEYSYKDIEGYAHQLKSSCMNMAALRLADLFKSLEVLINDEEYYEIASLWQAINNEFNLVEKEYNNLVGSYN